MTDAARPGPAIEPYGSWRSPISVERVIAGSRPVRETSLDGDDVLWIEQIAAEGGRQTVMRLRGGAQAARPEELTPGVNVRSRVHEYGGTAYLAAAGVLWYSDFADGRLYERGADGSLRPLTPAGEWRYADMRLDAVRRRLLCVREDHTPATLERHGEAVNEIVAVALDPADADGGLPLPEVLASGRDFYAAPRLSPDGRSLAWISWDHPNMPWDATALWLAALDDAGAVREVRRVAGGPEAGESLVAPEWSPEGALHVVGDRTGWWNLYRVGAAQDATAAEPGEGVRLVPVAPMAADAAEPLWQLGYSWYAFSDRGIVLAATSEGRNRLGLVGADGVFRPLDVPDTEVDWVHAAGTRVVYMGAGPGHPSSVVELDLATGSRRVLRASSAGLDPACVSAPEPIAFATAGGATAHALFYPPRNPEFRAPEGELPPAVVRVHGGPTGRAGTGLKLTYQFLTTRGFAVVDVDYRGSTGYGRPYRRALDGEWGIADVEDVVAAVRHLVAAGRVDGGRVAIAGGSAGGFTVLAALTASDVFAAGVSLFGVADLGALARDTHKFESRYLDGLVGPYPAEAALYEERSPINHTDRLATPLLLLQGLDDRVVPPAQAEAMAAALRAKGIPYAYIAFEGEGHGFRRADSLRRWLEAELSFYGRLFGFEPADEIEPVVLEGGEAR